MTYPYRWAWSCAGTRDGIPYGAHMQGRKGMACRVLCRGRMNSALVEFADGARVVTSRNGLRREA